MMKKLAQVDLGDTYGSPFGVDASYGIGGLISILLNVGLVVAGIILLFLLIGGGLQMIASAGNNDPKGAQSGKEAVTWAIAGFLIVFAAYWIIRIIEAIVGVEFLTAPGLIRGDGPGGR